MTLDDVESNDATGRPDQGAAGASNAVAWSDEQDDADGAVVASGYGPGAYRLFPSASSGSPFPRPTDVHLYE